MNGPEDTGNAAGAARISSPRHVHLRAGRPDDAPLLADVFVSAWRDSYSGVVPEPVLQRLDEADRASWLGSLLADSAFTTVVAVGGAEEVLGFCRFGKDPDDPRRGHVYSLYVRPSASRTGVGGRLLRHCLATLADRGLEPVTLWVFERNVSARDFYGRFGFSADGTRRVEEEFAAEEIRLVRAGGRAR